MIPERRYGVFRRDRITVPAGVSIGQAIASIIPNVIGKTPPAGKKYVLSLKISGYMEDA